MWSNKQGQVVGRTQTFWFPECWLMKTRTPFSAIALSRTNLGDVGARNADEQGDVKTSYLEPVLPGTVL